MANACCARLLTHSCGLGLLFCLAQMQVACAHPFHISLAEMEYNPQSGRWEVSLKVHVVDLDRSLKQLSEGAKVDLKQAESAQLVEEFLDRYVYLLPLEDAQQITSDWIAERTATDLGKIPRSQAKYIGHEQETSWVWLYFELQPPPDTSGDLALVNAVFLDTLEKQINTVSIRQGIKRHALKLTRKEPWGRFPKAWMEP